MNSDAQTLAVPGHATRRSTWPVVGVLLLACALPLVAVADEHAEQWKSLEQMSSADQALFDPSTQTPRDTAIAYIPAEAYPFQPPYTAEEMGYRSSEFVHISRWPLEIVDVFGVVTSSGYINQGVSVSYTAPIGRPGLEGYIRDVKAGEPYARWTLFDTFPPESEGAQQLWLPYRTDKEHRTKMDFYVYSEQLRRVRRQPQPRRDQRFPDNSQTFDDVIGRDPWELEWQLLGTDVLYETVRFPNTRPTITLNRHGQGFVELQSAALKMMGDAYPHYRSDGGVDCWVMKATIREDWLPDYGEKTLIFWLDKHLFYPLRMEKYNARGELMMIEARQADVENPALGDFGYSSEISVYWNVEHDLVGYSLHDGQAPRQWTEEEQKTIFTPEFMRRKWLITPIKTQALIREPDHFFLRPHLYPGRFPGERNPTVPADVQARFDAQEAAGHLVFETPASAAAQAQTEHKAAQ